MQVIRSTKRSQGNNGGGRSVSDTSLPATLTGKASVMVSTQVQRNWAVTISRDLELRAKPLRKQLALSIPSIQQDHLKDSCHTQPCANHRDETLNTILAWPS